MRKVLLLLMLLPMIADAALFDFEVDGIYYKISNGSDVSVASTYYGNDYSGNVTIPSSVTYNGTTYSVKSIGSSAFYYCTGLTSISIPNSITSISGNAFEGCSSLDTVYISDIAAWCNIFFNNKNSLYYANPLYFAKHLILNGVEMTDLTIPDSVTAISDFAFYHFRGLRSITIGNAVTTIGSNVFYGCSGLTSVTIPNSVTEIGYNAFSYCSRLTSVTIPNTVTTIYGNAFSWCGGLTNITVESGNPEYDSRDNCNAIIETANNTLMVGCLNTVIPKSVTFIGGEAFSGCSGLTSIEIPNSVTSIGKDAFYACAGLTELTIPKSVTSIGDRVCVSCVNLTSITVASGNSHYDSRGNCNAIIETASNTLIAGCQNTVIPNSVKAIGDEAFLNISSLRGITIPNSVTSIGEWAFYGCSGLEEVTMGKRVITIDGHAFRDCYSLKSITLPATVTTIGEWAFDECRSLTDVYSYITDLSKVSYGTYPFYLHGGNYSGRTLHVPQGTAGGYQADGNWRPYFGQIVDDLMPEDYPQGDVNHDNEVNIADVNAVIDIILGGNTYTPEADVNRDGEVNIADINVLIDIILSGSWN